MDLTRIAAASTEYVHATIQLAVGGTPIAPTDPELAIVAHPHTPAEDDWWPAEMIGRTARILVGPAGGVLTLTPGSYHVWARWTAGHETPVHLLPRRLTVYGGNPDADE